MRRRSWTCRKCGFRQYRTSSVQCRSCGEATKPPLRPPKHRAELDRMSLGDVALLSVLIHGGEAYSCARCRRPIPPDKRRHRDHSKRTGQVRGLLCYQCNAEHVRSNELADILLTLAYLLRVAMFYARRALAKAAG